MRIANVGLLNFCAKNYKNSKYYYPDVSKNILNTEDTEAFLSMEKFPKDLIDGLFDSFKYQALQMDINKKINFLNSVVDDERNDSVELAKILELTKEQKISAIALFGLVAGVQLTQEATDDINKMCYALENNIDIRDVFCPEFKNEKEADGIAEIGDVFILDGDEFVKIKTQKGIEDLFLTKDTYLELFPPLERFGAVQSGSGDCYLISVFDSIYQNPNSRDYILKMFKENPDETIDCCFAGYQKDVFGNVIKRDENAFELKKANSILQKCVEKQCFNFAIQPEALRLIELLWDVNLQFKTFNSVKDKNRLFKKAILKLGKNIDDTRHSLKEKLNFIRMTEKYMYRDFNNEFLDFYPLEAFDMDVKSVKDFIEVSKKYKKYKIKPDTNMTALEHEYLLQILMRHMEYYEKHNKTSGISELLPKNCYEFLFGETDSYLKMAGATLLVGDVLGLNSKKITFDDNLNFMIYFIFFEYDPKKHILTCYTSDKKTEDEFEVEYHEYACSIREENGEKMITVRNPYNTMFEKSYSLEEFAKIFKGLYITEIPE